MLFHRDIDKKYLDYLEKLVYETKIITKNYMIIVARRNMELQRHANRRCNEAIM